MNTAAEQLNRRIGRMEALAFDLSRVKPGYQPTELELTRARELAAALEAVYAAPAPEEAAPEEADPKKPDPKKPGKK